MKFMWLALLLVQGMMCVFFHRNLKDSGGDSPWWPVVENLQNYVRIDSSKEENYELVVKFWEKLAADNDLPIAVYRPAGLPVCVITLRGSRPELPSIMLNTHSDVVPAYDNLWNYPPFAALIENGKIYGRGTQDTKTLAIQHFEAIRYFKNNNITLQRTVYVTIMPDEEVGGFRGIKEFIKTDDFRRMNVGFVLDEGMGSTDDTFYATYVDRRPWQINMTIYGQGGHGSQYKERNVIQKLTYILNSALQFQEEQKILMDLHNNSVLGQYTSLNVNIIKAGIATNIIPSSVNVVMDIRLGTNANVSDIQNMIDTWQNATGPGTKVEYIRKDLDSPATVVDDTNPYWVAIQDAARDMNITIKPIVLTATSDMLVIRKLGISAIGFAPMNNINLRIHNNDEYINIDTFLKGIQIITKIVEKLGNLE